ncbi:MAG: M73 family secreted endopeptidase [Candidatus Methanohalarchaeum thermophilum]|uniref:M73 family secreted endopeptidase n=1 Tax=Methanohalarchaeum thermophilum TaxID=1903181 RepID=A0A1Q6DXK7_METT1|nr:MAG: M73 family secreted endopeptidase [Candidatus Methanohalarchaeum thermophilum]
MAYKKALLSLMVIGLVGVAAGAGTFAFFTDEEKATGNTLTAGTIDLAVNGQNPWNETFTIDDMKPCEKTGYIVANITNEGSNPAKVYKMINVTSCDTGLEIYETTDGEMYSSEPEWQAEKDGRVDDIHTVTDYSMMIELYENETTFYADDPYADSEAFSIGDDVTVGDKEGTWFYLGELQPGEVMKVTQDYHLLNDTGNEYQGDAFTFDITFGATQLNDDTTIQGTVEDVSVSSAEE